MGVDLGGSHASSWLFDRDGNTCSPLLQTNMSSRLKAEALVQEVTGFIQTGQRFATSRGCEVVAGGLGAPGPLDPFKGVMISPPNLPNVRNLRVIDLLGKPTGLKFFLINDADAAVLGEHWQGVAKGFDEVAMLTLGTGVGSGLISGGKLQRGRGMGGEWGHTTISHCLKHKTSRLCSCGRRDCLEAYCGTEGLIRSYCEVFDKKRESIDSEMNLEISKQMRSNKADQWVSLLDIYCSDLAQGVINMINVHDPDCVVLGGGIACNVIAEKVMTFIRSINNYQLNVMTQGMTVRAAATPNSGVIGAAKYAIDRWDAETEARAAEWGIVT